MKVTVVRRRKRKPKFKRQVWYSYKKIGTRWRRPRGIRSKLRRHKKHRGFRPSPGYGSPRSIRGVHPCGLTEVLVCNAKQLGTLDPKTSCVRLSATLGRRKREEIAKKAGEMGIRVVNLPKKYPAKPKPEEVKK